MIGNWARTIAFRIAFLGLSVPIVLLAPVAALISFRAMQAYAHGWAAMVVWLARWIVGIRVTFEGTPTTGRVLYAVKHQAMFETMLLTGKLGGPAIVMKQELARIPVWGYVARRYGVIVVDREASAGALRRMINEAKAARAAGRSILIFPEGTRVGPGEQPSLKAGFAGLYKLLALPVVPVALDSGNVWPRTGPMRPGLVTFRFGKIVPPGLPRAEAEAQVHAAINALENHHAIGRG